MEVKTVEPSFVQLNRSRKWAYAETYADARKLAIEKLAAEGKVKVQREVVR